MRPTMADVAERAGVSTSTVSLVLNNKPGASSRVRAAVLRAVDELGYRLPQRRKRSPVPHPKTITVVHFAGSSSSPDASGLSGLAACYVKGIQAFCQERNVNWALIASYEEGNAQHVGAQLLERTRFSFDGLIVMMPHSRESRVVQRALVQGIPVVVISRDWPELPISTVSQDHLQQARLAVDHLVQLGHRKIAFLACTADQPYDWFSIRRNYYRETMRALGIYEPELVVIDSDIRQATRTLICARPDVTAIFAAHDGCAVQVIQVLDEMGTQVPERISVIGVGNDPRCVGVCPNLTTIGFPAQKVGYLAARVAFEHIQDPELAYSRVFVKSWLVEGETCSRPYGSDQSVALPTANLLAKTETALPEV